jgi:outer membrane protein, heavy metal efflux system
MKMLRAGRRIRRAWQKVTIATVLAAVLATSAGAQSPADAGHPGPITLEEALHLFRTRGFDLIIADALIVGAQGDMAVAHSIANPSLSISRGSSFNYDPSLCEGCSSRSISGGVTDQAAISDALSGKRRLRVAVAQAALESTKRSRADVERTLEFTVKQQVLQAELAKQSLGYARESQRLATDTLNLVDTRYKAGAVSEADVARAEVQKLEADQAADMAEQTSESAKAGVAFLLGYKDTPPDLDFADDLTHSGAADLANASRETFLERARAERPDFAAARFQVQRAHAALDLAKRQRVPDFFPSVQYAREGSGQNAIQPPTLTFGVSASLPVFYRYQGEIAKAEGDLRTQETVLNKIDAQIGSDVSTAYAVLTSARSRTSRMESRLLTRAALARDLVRLQYQKGATSLFEFLDAQRTFLGTQTEYLQTLNDYWTAVFQLEQATGTELHR